jgi:hypothetical protein
MKTWFLTRAAREKLLLVALAVAAALIWGTRLNDRVRVVGGEVRQTNADLTEQRMWLERRESIEAEAEAAVRNLDPARTFNGVRLSAEVSAVAQGAGLGANATSGGLRTERTPQFAVHTLELNLRGVAWNNLLSFYAALSERAPYIGIEEFALTADRNNPASLNATLRVSSVEIAR